MAISINMVGWPKHGCGGDLVPIEDVTQEGQVYLKGWVCLDCKVQAMFRRGDVFVESTKDEEA